MAARSSSGRATARCGTTPGSPTSTAGSFADLDRRIIVMCDEGYQPSLVAATLRRLGFEHATDLIGGYQAWRAMNLPVERHRDRPRPR